MFLCEVRLRIYVRLQVAIMLHQSRGDGSEFDIPVEPVKNCLVRQRCVLYNLSAIGGFLRYPTLELHQNSRISHKHCLKLRCRSRHTLQIFLGEIGRFDRPHREDGIAGSTSRMIVLFSRFLRPHTHAKHQRNRRGENQEFVALRHHLALISIRRLSGDISHCLHSSALSLTGHP